MKPGLIKASPFDFLAIPRPALGLDPWRLLAWEKLNMQSSKPEGKKHHEH
jgi:hypothetical protein